MKSMIFERMGPNTRNALIQYLEPLTLNNRRNSYESTKKMGIQQL